MKMTFSDTTFYLLDKTFSYQDVSASFQEPDPLWERQAPKNGTSQVDFNLDSPVTWRQKVMLFSLMLL